MVLPLAPLEKDPTRAFGFAGMNGTNPAVGIVKNLVATWLNKDDVIPAIPSLQTAILSDPKLTLVEAVELHHQLYGFYVGYFGSAEPQLSDLLHAIEDLYPDERTSFEV